MSYIKRKGYGMMGLGASAADCVAGQSFYGDVTWAGVTGQCLTPAQYSECKSTGKLAGQSCTVAGKSAGTSWWQSLIGGATEVVKAKVTPAPVTQITTTAPSGMSTTTKVALAGAGVLALALILKRRK